MLGKIVSGVIISSLLTFPQTTVTSFATCEDTVNNNNNKIKDIKIQQTINHLNIQMNNIKDFGNKSYRLDKNIEEYNYIKEKVNERLDNIEKRKIEEQKKIEEERNSYNIDFLLTYYSKHPSENNGYTKTAMGTELREGILASCYYSLGTTIEFEDGRRYRVEDRGAKSIFSNPNRLDVFVDTYNQDYVRGLGVTKIRGKIVEE